MPDDKDFVRRREKSALSPRLARVSSSPAFIHNQTARESSVDI